MLLPYMSGRTKTQAPTQPACGARASSPERMRERLEMIALLGQGGIGIARRGAQQPCAGLACVGEGIERGHQAHTAKRPLAAAGLRPPELQLVRRRLPQA